MKIAYTYVNDENGEEELSISEIEGIWFEKEYGMCISFFREDIYDQYCRAITKEMFEKIKEKALANENLDLSEYKFHSIDDDDDDGDEEAEENDCCDEKPEYTEADSQACIVPLTIMAVVIIILIMAFYSGV